MTVDPYFLSILFLGFCFLYHLWGINYKTYQNDSRGTKGNQEQRKSGWDDTSRGF